MNKEIKSCNVVFHFCCFIKAYARGKLSWIINREDIWFHRQTEPTFMSFSINLLPINKTTYSPIQWK